MNTIKIKSSQLSTKLLKDKVQEILDLRLEQFQKGIKSDIGKLLSEKEYEQEDVAKDIEKKENHLKQKQLWTDIDELFNSPKKESDYILRGFKIVKKEKDKTIVVCSMCSHELNSRGAGFHWKLHEKKLKRLSLVNLVFEKEKFYITCENCSKKKKVDLFETLRNKHWEVHSTTN